MGEGGWAREAASLEDTQVSEGEGERGMSTEERRASGGYGERRSGGLTAAGGFSAASESLEERSVVTIAGILDEEGGMSGIGEERKSWLGRKRNISK